MRLNFNKVEIHNFMCFEDEVFEFDKMHGLTLVCGKNNDIPGSRNGVGKSQGFFSLIYCLFGDLPNHVKNENIHNKYVPGKEVRICAYFDVDKTSYKVASGFDKYGSPYCNLSEFLADGSGEEKDLTKSSIAETRKFIENEVLHCDLPLFLRTIFLTSDQTYNFFRLSKHDKKDFIEKLFDIAIFGEMYSSMHHDILSKEKDLLAEQSKMLVLTKNDKDYSSYMSNYEEKRKASLAELNESLNKAKTEYDDMKKKAVNHNESEQEKLEDESNAITDEQNKIQAAIRKLDNAASKIDSAMHKLDAMREVKQNVIDKHKSLLSKLCEKCKIVFSDYYNLSKYIEEIKQIDIKAREFSSKKESILSMSKNQQEKIANLESKSNDVKTKLDDLEAEFKHASMELNALESNISRIESSIESTKSAQNPYVKMFSDNEAMLKSEEKLIESCSDEYRHLDFAQGIVSQDTIKQFIIKDLISVLNNRIAYYLTKLGSKYKCIFDENMNYTFLTSGGEYEFYSFSAGERMRLTIATSFAFRDFMAKRSNLTSNILILDELIDSNLDSLAIESIIKILKEFTVNYNQNVFIISHRKEIDNSCFNNIIQLVKTDNISKIEYLQ
jgi:DNA repair exonuclease SbcCD ATPase subunit